MHDNLYPSLCCRHFGPPCSPLCTPRAMQVPSCMQNWQTQLVRVTRDDDTVKQQRGEREERGEL